MNNRYQHGLWTLVASCTMMVLPGDPIQKASLSSSQAAVIAWSQGDPMTRHQVQDLSLCLHKFQAVIHLSADPAGQ